MSSTKGKLALAAAVVMILLFPSIEVFAPPLMRAQGLPSAQPTVRQNSGLTPEMAHRQRKALRKMNFDQMKRNADQLTKLAQALKADLDKSNPEELPVGVLKKARRIQKLAKKIQNEVGLY